MEIKEGTERNLKVTNEKTEVYLGSKNQPLSLGECNNGDKFTEVSQAINQAKDFVNCCVENNW